MLNLLMSLLPGAERRRAEAHPDPSHEMVLSVLGNWSPSDTKMRPRDWPPFVTLVERYRDDPQFVLRFFFYLDDRDIVRCADGALLDRREVFAPALFMWKRRLERILARPDVSPERRFAWLGLVPTAAPATLTTAAGNTITYTGTTDRYLYPKSTQVVFLHERGRCAVNMATVTSFDLLDDRVVINGYPSPFDFPLEVAERSLMEPLFAAVSHDVAANLARMERAQKRSSASAPTAEADAGMNPWLAGALGLATGVVLLS